MNLERDGRIECMAKIGLLSETPSTIILPHHVLKNLKSVNSEARKLCISHLEL